jgi:hypothetical protein
VIGNRAVADSYLLLMDMIGVDINLTKSILSYKGIGLEFAKRTFVNGVDCSPISLRDLSLSLQPGNISSWVAFAKAHKLDFNLQRKVLGFGYRTCINSFIRMNHALQVLYLANVAKVDFNTQVLNLRNKVPVDLDSLLPLFKADVLVPAIRLLMDDLRNLRRYWEDAIYLFTHTEATLNGLQQTANLANLSLKDITLRFNAAAHQMGFSDIQKIHTDLTLAFKGIYDLNKIKSMDDALSAYFKLIKDKATLNIALLKLEESAVRPSSKLPFQARLFRAWSRITSSMIKKLRLNK